jgi:hypothetical protein
MVIVIDIVSLRGVPPMRFTIRRLMLLIALAGVFLALIAYDLWLQERARTYRRRAWRMGSLEETNRSIEAQLRRQSESKIPGSPS